MLNFLYFLDTMGKVVVDYKIRHYLSHTGYISKLYVHRQANKIAISLSHMFTAAKTLLKIIRMYTVGIVAPK